MCGIAGLIAPDGLHHDERARVERMRDVLAHRGPDGAGLYASSTALLAHRRLAIVDLAGGHQPLSNETGRIWVTYNGEIYNHAELRPTLEAAGHTYRTRSDTEAIIHAYEQWGDACVQRFRGMFAFAIWDEDRRRLLLVRDRLGVKPVYWTLVPASGDRGARLLFGSEIKAILASGLVTPTVNEAAVPEMLAMRGTAGTDTLFAGIHKLLPGHQLVYQDGVLTVTQYWDIPHDGPDAALARRSDASLIDEFRERLTESVRLRLMADVPLGMFLSGGLDSSAIAALMASMVGRPIETFSVAFEDQAYSELAWAREVAIAIGANRHEVVVRDDEFFGALPRLLWHEDEPIAHPSSVPLHFVSALARRHVTVVLTGEGSDELLAGYGRYPRTLANWRAAGVYERLAPDAVRTAVAHRLVPRLPRRLRRYADRSFLGLPRSIEAMVFDNFAAIPLALQRQLLVRSGGHDPYAAARRYFDVAAPDLLGRLLYTDLKTYLVELLMKQDQMSMSASIESRVPFLDHTLVEFAARLPVRLKLRGLTTKRVLREAVRGILPDSILTRPKMGFPVPFGAWSSGRWHRVVADVLLDRRTRERGVVQPHAVEQLLAAHRDGSTQAGDPLWALLNLELWYRTFIDGDGIQTLPSPGPAAARAA